MFSESHTFMQESADQWTSAVDCGKAKVASTTSRSEYRGCRRHTSRSTRNRADSSFEFRSGPDSFEMVQGSGLTNDIEVTAFCKGENEKKASKTFRHIRTNPSH